jgi:hypothetical protein
MNRKTLVLEGEILEVNLTDRYIKLRDLNGRKCLIKAMLSQLVRNMPGSRVKVEVTEGYAVSIKPVVKDNLEPIGLLEEEKQDV